jgi:hypothetical protein
MDIAGLCEGALQGPKYSLASASLACTAEAERRAHWLSKAAIVLFCGEVVELRGLSGVPSKVAY